MKQELKLLSVVIPVYNEQDNLQPLLDRIVPVMESVGAAWEVIFINDGSRDNSLPLLRAAEDKNPNIRVINLARNFGQHAAVIAGFEASKGDFVVTLDADMQNPPEEISRIVEKYRQGYDCVGTVRQNRQDTFFRKFASARVNNFVRSITGIKLNDFGCMLRGYSREVVDAIVAQKTFRTFIPASGYVYAANPVEIDVSHENRFAGKSNYSFFKLVSLMLDLVICFSRWPVSLLLCSGIVISCIGTLLGALILVMRFCYGVEWAVQGIFTLFAITFIFIGLQFLCLGLIGDYIGRIYNKVMDMPVYIAKKHKSQD